MKKIKHLWKTFTSYMKRTMINKMLSGLLMGMAFIVGHLCNDYTVFIFTCLIGIPWFFARQNLSYID